MVYAFIIKPSRKSFYKNSTLLCPFIFLMSFVVWKKNRWNPFPLRNTLTRWWLNATVNKLHSYYLTSDKEAVENSIQAHLFLKLFKNLFNLFVLAVMCGYEYSIFLLIYSIICDGLCIIICNIIVINDVGELIYIGRQIIIYNNSNCFHLCFWHRSKRFLHSNIR